MNAIAVRYDWLPPFSTMYSCATAALQSVALQSVALQSVALQSVALQSVELCTACCQAVASKPLGVTKLSRPAFGFGALWSAIPRAASTSPTPPAQSEIAGSALA